MIYLKSLDEADVWAYLSDKYENVSGFDGNAGEALIVISLTSNGMKKPTNGDQQPVNPFQSVPTIQIGRIGPSGEASAVWNRCNATYFSVGGVKRQAGLDLERNYHAKGEECF